MGKKAMWAPAIIKKGADYFLFFGANDVHPGEVGGIGVGVSKPRSFTAFTRFSFNPRPSNAFIYFFYFRRKGKLIRQIVNYAITVFNI